MIANNFTMTRQPYEPNYRGLVDAVIDVKEGFPNFAPLQVGFDATAFENVSESDALYMRTSDGQVGKASAADGTVENATVVGFANADATANLKEQLDGASESFDGLGAAAGIAETYPARSAL